MKQPELTLLDPYLKPFAQKLEGRRRRAILRTLDFTDGKRPLKDCFNNHLYYGLHKTANGWVFREKAPNAVQVYIYGEFSYWEVQQQYALKPIGNGDWEIELPASFLHHCDLYKLWMVWQNGADERLPSHATRVVQDENTKIFAAQVWDPETPYEWKYPQPSKPQHPLIYEAHVGMSSQKEEIASYWSFKETVLPRIRQLGYNTIQLMAVQEHPYYGSFGYQVANFYAPSYRFGTPDELKELIDEAHHAGISVILDVVHSHSVANDKEGLSHFDGSEDLYFHAGERGHHPVWDSRCFNYGKQETLSFLLSNVKYWLEEFRFDGFRFDGVTSMCYWNHGIGVDFVDYQQYFDGNVDEDALVYLTLANQLVKEVNPQAMTVAEDVSGMPGMAFPVEKGGIGFDYRMSMGVADYWTKLVKESSDDQWHVGDMFFRLTDKRSEEKVISYVESHDQAMVGDKTLIFRLIDKNMYDSMSVLTPDLTVDRGVALHKMIRLVTLGLSQGGYLNFMGNEFGHPEWIDFPREGNGWSYKYARRQWNLADDTNLKYHGLNLFDEAMIHTIEKYRLLDGEAIPLVRDNERHLLVVQRNNALMVFNFHPTESYSDYEIACLEGTYKAVLDTDAPQFCGFGNVNGEMLYPTFQKDGSFHLKLYIPSRVALVLIPAK
ncbi:MAG: alpha amylase C-terminal domain-containing protein [Bacteroidales bacterium]|nr:alpha amylase C-terminal domain-containing protein [Bacteroidales bacterium]